MEERIREMQNQIWQARNENDQLRNDLLWAAKRQKEEIEDIQRQLASLMADKPEDAADKPKGKGREKGEKGAGEKGPQLATLCSSYESQDHIFFTTGQLVLHFFPSPAGRGSLTWQLWSYR